MLWKRIRYVIPGRFGSNENVFAWTHLWVAIDTSQYHFRHHSGMSSNKRGAAGPAKAPLSSGRGLVRFQQFRA